MHRLIIIPREGKTLPDERVHNSALLERYMPEFPDFFREANRILGASIIGIKIDVPDSDLEFVESNMDETKRLKQM